MVQIWMSLPELCAAATRDGVHTVKRIPRIFCSMGICNTGAVVLMILVSGARIGRGRWPRRWLQTRLGGRAVRGDGAQAADAERIDADLILRPVGDDQIGQRSTDIWDFRADVEARIGKLVSRPSKRGMSSTPWILA